MKTILALSVLVIITTPYCYSAYIEDTTTDTNTAGTTSTIIDEVEGIDEMDIDIEAQTVNIIKGKKGCDDSTGPQGEQGPPGPPGGGALYTRWGRTVCPNTNGTGLVYKGLVAGTCYSSTAGGANYLCITEEPEYLSSTVPKFSANDPALSYLWGTEYQLPGFSSLHDHNVPCAVCHTSQRSSKLMIPGKTSCPTSWTEEYKGYLVAEREHVGHKHSKVYECMDKDGEAVPGESRSIDGALFQLVVAKCNVGLPCPKYVADRPITCVVCTK